MSHFTDKLVVRSRAVKRLLMWHYCSKKLPLYLVPEFPKSGGTWFSQMLAECLEVPFPRNTSRPRFEKSVLSGHHLYSPQFHNVVVVIRDGRDALVSMYYHLLFSNEINKNFAVEGYRKDLGFTDYDDIHSNLPAFIEYVFTVYSKKRFHFSWADFIDSWLVHDVPVVRYEDLLTQPVEELRRVSHILSGNEVSEEHVASIVDKYSFSKISGRKQGEADKRSFVRKGIAGDWKNQFSVEACEVFDQFAGNQLIQAGYESNRDWIHNSNRTAQIAQS
ncbi:MAG: sulfotransferase domain-containing protein [Fuerstiella sp.]